MDISLLFEEVITFAPEIRWLNSKKLYIMQGVFNILLPRLYSRSKENVVNFKSATRKGDIEEPKKLFNLFSSLFNAHFTSPEYLLANCHKTFVYLHLVSVK